MNYLIIFFSLLFMNTSSDKHTLTVTVSNIKTMEGTLEIGIFDSGHRFLEEGQALRSISIDVNNHTETFVVKNLPKGNYAVTLYHDENGNKECDRNFMGIPKEPYAFSNNYRPRFSAPTFEDCAFELSADKSVQLELNN